MISEVDGRAIFHMSIISEILDAGQDTKAIDLVIDRKTYSQSLFHKVPKLQMVRFKSLSLLL